MFVEGFNGKVGDGQVTGGARLAHQKGFLEMISELRFFLILIALYSSLLITSMATGSKLFPLPFGLSHLSASAAVLSFMLTLVILNAIAELYGSSYSRFTIYLGLAVMLLSAAYFLFAIWLPAAKCWHDQEAFEAVLGKGWRIWLGGWAAYLVSQHLDLWSFLKLRNTAAGRVPLVFRALASKVLGQLVDTAIFVLIAFYDSPSLPSIIGGQLLAKLAIATVASPLVWIIVALGRRLIEQPRDDDAGRDAIIKLA
jgi:queuosine precursor transporter